MIEKRANKEQSAPLAEAADDYSITKYNHSRHYEEMESSCCAEDTNKIDKACNWGGGERGGGVGVRGCGVGGVAGGCGCDGGGPQLHLLLLQPC
ncbi:GD11937 [Drosophila simulans]|uniref:GD11937 n=1 Tax=Drosophila simulans TaxID=7240 RepID=B4NTJ3_DROSI|nr:GD11937 [Drosophila simulans]